MLKKNEFTIGVLALLLTIGLAGSAFASNQNYIELDASDYRETHNGFDVNPDQTSSAVHAEVAQNDTQVPGVVDWVNQIELDESDYSDGQYGSDANQTHRLAQVAFAQTTTSESSIEGWVNLIELDEGNYKYATPDNSSKRVHCAGAGSTGQLSNC